MDFLANLDIDTSKIFKVYRFGSRVYGTESPSSDYDYVIVGYDFPTGKEIRQGIYNVHLYDVKDFQHNLSEHKITALECYFQDPKGFEFELDKSKLRKEVSRVSSNSWVKAKKKMTLAEEDTFVGLKSLFHSFRILDFGIQIAEHGKIIDYRSMNWLWDEIIQSGQFSWEYYNKKYKAAHNIKNTTFRKVAPK